MDPTRWRVEHLVEVDSTNTWVGARAQAGEPEGLVAVADFQTRGRGRLDRTWEAAPGTALLCSILLRPQLDLDDVHLGVAAVALALREAVERLTGRAPELKWPNDLLVDRVKVAGILAEVEETHDGVALIVGVGVNLSDHPEGATDLREATGVAPRADDLLAATLEALGPRREALSSPSGRELLWREYEATLATLGQRVRVTHARGELVGTATRLDESGRLIVEVDGEEHAFATGDVVHVRLHEDEG